MEKHLTFHESLQITEGLQRLLNNKRMTPSVFVRLLYKETDRVAEQNAYRKAFDEFASSELKETVEEVRRLQIRLAEVDKPLGQD